MRILAILLSTVAALFLIALEVVPTQAQRWGGLKRRQCKSMLPLQSLRDFPESASDCADAFARGARHQADRGEWV